MFSKPIYDPVCDDIKQYTHNTINNTVYSQIQKPPKIPRNELLFFLICIGCLMYYIDYIFFIYYTIALFIYASIKYYKK